MNRLRRVTLAVTSLRPHSSPRPVAGLRRRSVVLAAVAATALWAPTAEAGGTKTHRVSDFDDFDEGEAEGTAIEGGGRVTVGYVHERGDVADAKGVFSCLADAKGRVVGTHGDAALYSVKPGKDGPVTERLAALEGAVVTAVTRLPNGDLIAATLPGGRIFRVDAKGEVSVFAKLEVEAIWALAIHKSRVLVATGPKGELFSLPLDGLPEGSAPDAAKIILDADDKHLLSLWIEGDDILVGTAPSARILRVDAKLEGQLLHDFRGDEVRAMAISDGALFAAVNDFDDKSTGNLPALSKAMARASLGGSGPSSNSANASSPKASAKLYRVDLRGSGNKVDLARASEAAWSPWLSKSKQYFTSLVPVAKGVLVSAAADGKVYRVTGLRDKATVADFDEAKATTLCVDKKGVLAATGDAAAVYALRLGASQGKANKALYRSEVFDAEQPATYGQLRVLGSGKFTVRARSGPSDEPDARWTAWRPVKLARSGAGFAGRVGVDKRRYLQFEITLQSADAEVRDLQVFYAPENLPPLLTSVEVQAPDFDLDDDDEPDASSKIKWSADARDDDELLYEVRLRAEGSGESGWFALNDGQPVTKKELELALDTVVDGVYEVSVRASDEPSNGSAKAMQDELRSDAFVIDHSRPTLSQLSAKGGRITGVASDAGSYIHDVSVSIDEGTYRSASPSDGLFDSSKESFDYRLPALGPGPHRVVVRARDAHGNLTVQALRLP